VLTNARPPTGPADDVTPPAPSAGANLERNP
jgi:hypothetical protein